LQFFRHFSSSRLTNGAGDVQVVEPSIAIKLVPIQWKNLKINLSEVAYLRWIRKMTVPEICNALCKSRSTVQVSIRTIRNNGVLLLNLKDFEKNLIEKEINREIEEFRKFGLKS